MEERAISSDLIRGHIDTIILNTLIDGDKYAQLISDTVEFESDGKYLLNQATLYSSLKRLENSGLVKSYWYDAEEGRRKYFSITHNGRKLVEENLSQWSFSKNIIDKLIGAPVEYKTIYSPIAPETSTQENLNYKQDNLEIAVQNVQNDEVLDFVEEVLPNNDVINAPILEEVAEQPVLEQEVQQFEQVEQIVEPTESENEVDYKSLLNNLFDYTMQQSSSDDVAPIVKETLEENIDKTPQEKPEKVAFKDTVSQKITHEHVKNCGIINYDDLSLKAAKEGYKIRFSSKDSAKKSGTFLINKVNFLSMLIAFMICVVEFGLLFTKIGDKMQVDLTTKLLLGALAVVILAIPTVIYAIKPKQTKNKTIRADSILNTAIIIFNVLLVTFVFGMIFNVNYHNPISFFWYAAIPCGTCFDLLVFVTARYFIAKNKKISYQIQD